MAPGVKTYHLYVVLRKLRGLNLAKMPERRRETARNPRIPFAKISLVVMVLGTTTAPKRATMSQDLRPPPLLARDFGMIKPRYPSSQVRLYP